MMQFGRKIRREEEIEVRIKRKIDGLGEDKE